MRQECDLALDRRKDRVACTRKSDEEGVALGVHLVALVGFEGGPEQALVLLNHLSVTALEAA